MTIWMISIVSIDALLVAKIVTEVLLPWQWDGLQLRLLDDTS